MQLFCIRCPSVAGARATEKSRRCRTCIWLCTDCWKIVASCVIKVCGPGFIQSPWPDDNPVAHLSIFIALIYYCHYCHRLLGTIQVTYLSRDTPRNSVEHFFIPRNDHIISTFPYLQQIKSKKLYSTFKWIILIINVVASRFLWTVSFDNFNCIYVIQKKKKIALYDID